MLRSSAEQPSSCGAVNARYNGKGNPRDHNVASTIILDCTPPHSYRWPGHPTARLVRIAEGSLKGEFVSVKNARVHLEEKP